MGLHNRKLSGRETRLPEPLEQIRTRLHSDGRWEGELQHTRRDGRRVFVASLWVLHRDKGDVPAAILEVNNDISELKRAEEERAHLLAREQAARAEAERANRLKDEFLATVSHELRTPLTSMLGWARMLRRGGLDESTREQALEVIDRNARMQAKLIEEILDLSRIVSGKVRLEIRAVDLPAIIDAAIDTVRPVAEGKSIRIEKVIDGDPGKVPADPERLQQVVWNLLSNAVKFTPEGGRAEVRLQRLNSEAEIQVSDDGDGIGPEFLPHVFEPFRQWDASPSRAHGGLGLGLTIARRLVEMHHGTIHAQSGGRGKGATFTVRLPLPQLESRITALPLPEDHSAALETAPVLNGVRVLVVEDDADTREFVRAVLESYGGEVRTVAGAKEALQAFDPSNTDVLVCDIGLPGEDGYALLRQIRALEASDGGSIPALALTAYVRTEDSQQALAAGFHMHVPKPTKPVQLARAIEHLARTRRR